MNIINWTICLVLEADILEDAEERAENQTKVTEIP